MEKNIPFLKSLWTIWISVILLQNKLNSTVILFSQYGIPGQGSVYKHACSI